MQSAWLDRDAEAAVARYADVPRELALRVYTTRLLGADRRLVLHGGGNTSLKSQALDLNGDAGDALHVKGSGSDMAEIEPAGLPAVRLAPLLKLRMRDALSEDDFIRIPRANLLDPAAPVTIGAMVGPEAFFEVRYLMHAKQMQALDAIPVIADEFEASFKRELDVNDVKVERNYAKPKAPADAGLMSLLSAFGSQKKKPESKKDKIAVIDAVGESRSNADVFGELCARLGFIDAEEPSGELDLLVLRDELGRRLHVALRKLVATAQQPRKLLQDALGAPDIGRFSFHDHLVPAGADPHVEQRFEVLQIFVVAPKQGLHAVIRDGDFPRGGNGRYG